MKAAGDGLVVYLEFLRDLCGGPEAGLLSEVSSVPLQQTECLAGVQIGQLRRSCLTGAVSRH
jgi:hypothetical protein